MTKLSIDIKYRRVLKSVSLIKKPSAYKNYKFRSSI